MRDTCRQCGSKDRVSTSGLCRVCDNIRLREYLREKRSTPEGRDEYNTYMRDYRRNRRRKKKES